MRLNRNIMVVVAVCATGLLLALSLYVVPTRLSTSGPAPVSARAGDPNGSLQVSGDPLAAQSVELSASEFQQFKVEPPTTEEIADFLRKNWGFGKEQAMEIAVGAAGNVRCALMDAQSVLDVRAAA